MYFRPNHAHSRLHVGQNGVHMKSHNKTNLSVLPRFEMGSSSVDSVFFLVRVLVESATGLGWLHRLPMARPCL